MARTLNRSLVHWLEPLPPSASGLMDRRQNLLGRRTEPIYGSDTVTLAGKNEKNSEFVVYTEDINPNVTFTTARLGSGVNHMVPLLLARWMASDLAAATSVFRHVAGLWNGTGFLDGAAVQAGRFSTRDLTYFLWAERATAGVRGFETDPAMVAAVEAQLWALQACEEGTALAVSYSGQGEALCPPHDGWGVGEQLVSIEANAMALALTDPRMRTVWFPRKADDAAAHEAPHTDGEVALPADRAAPQARKTDDDIELVRQRLLSSILSNTGSADSGASLSASDATSFAKSLQPDGSWPDVNYTDRTRTGAWSPEKHLKRQLTMAIVARKTNDTTLVNAVHRALDFFLARSAPNGTTFPFGEIHSSNWFCGEIWTPSMLGNLALAFEPWLTAHETQVTVAIMMRSNWAKYKRTGANLVSELSTQIKRGALLRNRPIVAAAFDRMWEGVRVSPPHGQTNGTDCMYEGCQTDGIQADRSYHQHGPQLLAGSYGSYTARETVISLGLAAGTSFTMDPDRTELFVELLLDGMRWMMVHQYFWQWSVVGRSLGSHIARPCCVGNSTGGLGDYLASIPSKRSAELKSFAAAMASGESGVASGATPLRGHRAYWCSDFAVQSSESPFDGSPWVATLLMHSNRTTAAACVNGQGAMNEHLADSMMYLYYNGTEYDGIFGSWDWLKLPGITAEQIPIRSCNYSTQQKLDSARMPMTGTVTTGIEGLSAMSLVAHNLTAKKCVAMLQHAIVSLVADVKCASNNAVITTIDSSISPGDVFVSVDGEDTPQRVSVGTVGKEFANVGWIHHNRTGYFTTFPDAPYRSIEITHAMVSSTNRRILFEAGFNHGTNVTGLLEHAGWITVPGVSLAQMQAGVRPNVTIVSNTKDTQAVMDHAKSQGMAAIWTRGASVAFPLPLFSVSSSSPATIIVTKLADGSVNITAADPSNDKDGLELHLVLSKHGLVGEDCKPRADGSTAVTINLPAGWDAGRSTSVLCASTHAP